MNRDEFMELVYETFADEPDNVLANGIIEAADSYAEHEKAQLSREGTTSDLISRQAAIDAANDWYEGLICGSINGLIKRLNALPPAQPERAEGEWVGGRCNKCGGHAPFWAMASTYYKSDFCPDCGAKMKGAKHETD